MADLPTNYYDDILSASMNGKKKFRLTYRNGTYEEVTIEDISEYDQYGSKFGAGDINKTNQAVNEKFDSGDVVDPMLTTEPGFAADAFKTKLKLEECFQSVSNGKALIASAITDKKVPTDATATFAEMAENILAIESGVDISDTTAVASQVSSGYVFYDKNGNRRVGTRPAIVTSKSGTETGTTIKDATNTHVVTFATPFDKIPTVKIGLSEAVFANNGSNATSVISISYSNVTRTGFTLTVKSSSTGYNVNWKVGWSAEA